MSPLDEAFQKGFSVLGGEALGFFPGLRRHPLGIRREMVDMLSRRRVLLAYLGQLVRMEMTCQLDDGGPEPAMHEGHAPRDESAHQDVRAILELLQDRKDLMTFTVGPPTSLDGFACNRLRETRCGTLGRHEDDAMPVHECHRCLGVHVGPASLSVSALHPSTCQSRPKWSGRHSAPSENRRP